jgi:hypothetical protein
MADVAASLSLWLPTDPPGLPPAPPARRMFDPRPYRNRDQPGVSNSTREWDNRLIATAVALGCPREDAEQARSWPPARLALLQLWCRVQDAAEGDHSAREAIDRVRVAFANRRHQRVAEALAAAEQPADAAELQSLMGLD